MRILQLYSDVLSINYFEIIIIILYVYNMSIFTFQYYIRIWFSIFCRPSRLFVILYCIIFYRKRRPFSYLYYYTRIIIYAQKVVARAHDVIIYTNLTIILILVNIFFLYIRLYIILCVYNLIPGIMYTYYSNRPTLEKNNVGNCTIE